MTDAFNLYRAWTLGTQINNAGKSIEYNPYRHVGTAEEFEMFVGGWRAQEERNHEIG